MTAGGMGALLLALSLALPASARAPDRSPLPHWRAAAPGSESPAGAADEIVAAAAARPTGRLAPEGIGALAVARSPFPAWRPEGLARSRRGVETRVAAIRVQPQPGLAIGRRGAVCGVPGLIGTALAPIPAAARGCGVAHPVRVTSVAGVALSTPATMDCATAGALAAWVQGALIPIVGSRGGGPAALHVAADYACRPRNNQKGARVSEHGRGKAIDISAIVLKNGAVLSVLKGWGDRKQGPLLKALHKAACGPFGTVLGPGANRFHRDHFHFDTASYRKGHYCR